jgi:hypothetical protein
METPAEQIWNQIKNLPIDLFSIPGKKVQDFCRFHPVEPSKAYLIPLTASSFLTALERSVGSEFSVEQVLHYIIVSKNISNNT